MAEKISQIISNVGNYLHNGHGRGIFSPERMAETRVSNCFGRLAIIGSALAEESPEIDTFLLIARNHGMEFESKSGRRVRWLAHAEAVLIDGSEGHLLDTAPFTTEADPSLHDLSHTTWLVDRPSGSIRHPERDAALREGELPEPELLRRYGPPAIRAYHHVFDVHPFKEGLEAYQSNTQNIVTQNYTQQDYADFYYSAIAPDNPRP